MNAIMPKLILCSDEFENRFYFDHSIPPVARAEIQQLILGFEPLIPSWCQRIGVYYEDDPKDISDSCQIATSYPYRQCCIKIFPGWINQSPDLQRRDLLHELLHIVLAPMEDFQRDLWEEMFSSKDDGPRSRFIKEKHKESCESVTQDLTYILLKLEQSGKLKLNGC